MSVHCIIRQNVLSGNTWTHKIVHQRMDGWMDETELVSGEVLGVGKEAGPLWKAVWEQEGAGSECGALGRGCPLHLHWRQTAGLHQQDALGPA